MCKNQKNVGAIWCFVIAFLITGLGTSGCRGENNKVNQENTTTTLYESSALPQGYVYGKIEPYVGKTKSERNVVSQLNSYNIAVLKGEIDLISTFLYPGAAKYFRNYYPDDYSDGEITKDLCKSFSDFAVQAREANLQQGIDIDFIVYDIIREIDLGETKIYVLPLACQLYKKDAIGEQYIHTTLESNENIVGVSFNGGVNWYFMTINDSTPNILKQMFSQDVVNQIMGY